MSMDVTNNYSQYYKGTEQMKSYGAGQSDKDTIVRYEFNTTGKDGSKVMDKMSKEETMQAMKDISSMYGDNVVVEFSGDGMARMFEAEKGYLGRTPSEEEAVKKAARQAEFDAAVIHNENTHPVAVPNVQTSEKLYGSLAGAGENVVRAVNGIIQNYLLPGNVSGMSEEQRKDRIAFGMEEAKYLAENYLDGDSAKEFLSAMGTIAKYGMNGKMEENGNVTYDIPKGLNSAGQVDDMDILKEKAPDLYQEINELNQRIINHKDGEKYGTKFLELHKKAAKVLNATNNNGETNSDAAVRKYKDWEEKIAKTELPKAFTNTNYSDLQSFFDSLQKQGGLKNAWMNNSMIRFMKWMNL